MQDQQKLMQLHDEYFSIHAPSKSKLIASNKRIVITEVESDVDFQDARSQSFQSLYQKHFAPLISKVFS
jgi:hypothetical protein